MAQWLMNLTRNNDVVCSIPSRTFVSLWSPPRVIRARRQGKPQRLRLPKVLLGKKSNGAPTSDSKHSNPEAAPSSKETPEATEAPSSMPKAQAPVAPRALDSPADEVKYKTPC